MKKNKLLIALVTLVSLGAVSCGQVASSGSGFDPNNNDLGYQWTDTTKPIVANKDTVSFKIYSPNWWINMIQLFCINTVGEKDE